jgi:chloramphenicol O-acetyltransferase type A
MPMDMIIEIEKWSRKDHFLFFYKFEEPFFGVTVKVDCTQAYQNAKTTGRSFFHYLYSCGSRSSKFHRTPE